MEASKNTFISCIVNTAANIKKTKRMLKRLKDTPIFNLPKVKSFIDEIKENEDGVRPFKASS